MASDAAQLLFVFIVEVPSVDNWHLQLYHSANGFNISSLAITLVYMKTSPQKDKTPVGPGKIQRDEPPPDPQATRGNQPTAWQNVADWYDHLVGQDGSEYQQNVIFPGILQLLGLLEKSRKDAPMRILDLACGQGALCRKLATLRASVLGIDAAPALIQAAQRREAIDQFGITYRTADATKLPITGTGGTGDSPVVGNAGVPPAGDAPILLPGSFDAITIILAIQNMQPLSPIWRSCHTLLKPGGFLLLVMMHPSFRVPQHSDWHWDAPKNRQSRLVSQYLTSTKIDIQTHPGLAAHGKSDASTAHFHRPLQAYINTLASAGLLTDHLAEWPSHKKSQAGPRQEELDRSRNEIPMFLALRAKRV
jgi:2-polyprenyl-3-methyl-5-hydroxy-6-metoxy-1,4-benzoquinol methylase